MFESFDLSGLIIAVFAASGFWSIIMAVLQRRWSKKDAISEDQKKMNKMVLGLGHDRICFLGMAYVDRGYITADEYDNLVTYLYEPYKELDGNGTAEFVINKVKMLPVQSGDEHAEINKTQIPQHKVETPLYFQTIPANEAYQDIASS